MKAFVLDMFNNIVGKDENFVTSNFFYFFFIPYLMANNPIIFKSQQRKPYENIVGKE